MNPDHYCTREQALRLAELRFKQPDKFSKGDVVSIPVGFDREGKTTYSLAQAIWTEDKEDYEIKVFSAAELIDILPNTIEAPSWEEGNHKGDIKTVTLFISKDAWEEGNTGWMVMYNQFLGHRELYSVAKEFTNISLAQAAADMLIWLIDKRYYIPK